MAALTNNLPIIGLGPSLASPRQAVISHMWPVAPTAAALAGAFMADGLAKGKGFFESFECTLRSMRGTNEQIVDRLPRSNSRLTKNLMSGSLQLEALQHWGSLAFIQ
jgi:hypothetical protein